ncbi:MAG: Nramp family divalent metal transporter [Candidatus Methanomethylicia archaeon]
MEKTEETYKIGDVKPPLPIKPMPEAPTTFGEWFKKFGPALIVTSLGISGFEAMQAPLSGSIGLLKISWIYTLGCTFAVIAAYEIARWTIATGEDIFQGFARLKPKHFWAIVWFLINTLMWIWPVWMGAAATNVARLFGIGDRIIWTIIGIWLVPILYALARYVYNLMEWIFKIVMIATTIATIYAAIVIIGNFPADTIEVLKGFFSFGIIPSGVSVTLMTAYLVQPGGGTINLYYSFYLREKGIGMCKYIGKVTGLFYSPEEVPETGFMFNAKDEKERKSFRNWMKYALFENIMTLWLLSMLFTYIYILAAYSTLWRAGIKLPSGDIPLGIAESLGKMVGPIGYSFFLFSVAFSLFDTQFGFYDAMAKVAADTLWYEWTGYARRKSYRFWYFLFLLITVAISTPLIWLAQPYFMWLFLQVFLAASAAIYLPLIVYMNNKYLPEEIKPNKIISALLLIWGIINLIFTILWIGENVFKIKIIA